MKMLKWQTILVPFLSLSLSTKFNSVFAISWKSSFCLSSYQKYPPYVKMFRKCTFKWVRKSWIHPFIWWRKLWSQCCSLLTFFFLGMYFFVFWEFQASARRYLFGNTIFFFSFTQVTVFWLTLYYTHFVHFDTTKYAYYSMGVSKLLWSANPFSYYYYFRFAMSEDIRRVMFRIIYITLHYL